MEPGLSLQPSGYWTTPSTISASVLNVYLTTSTKIHIFLSWVGRDQKNWAKRNMAYVHHVHMKLKVYQCLPGYCLMLFTYYFNSLSTSMSDWWNNTFSWNNLHLLTTACMKVLSVRCSTLFLCTEPAWNVHNEDEPSGLQGCGSITGYGQGQTWSLYQGWFASCAALSQFNLICTACLVLSAHPVPNLPFSKWE